MYGTWPASTKGVLTYFITDSFWYVCFSIAGNIWIFKKKKKRQLLVSFIVFKFSENNDFLIADVLWPHPPSWPTITH